MIVFTSQDRGHRLPRATGGGIVKPWRRSLNLGFRVQLKKILNSSDKSDAYRAAIDVFLQAKFLVPANEAPLNYDNIVERGEYEI